MRKLQVTYYDSDTEQVYINRTFATDIDLQDVLMRLVADITDKEDELEAEDEPDAN